MKNYLLLIIFCITSVGCQSFRASRKPQSAGFGGYCPTSCITQNIDKDLAKLNNTVKVGLSKKVYTTQIKEKYADGFIEGTELRYSNGDEEKFYLREEFLPKTIFMKPI